MNPWFELLQSPVEIEMPGILLQEKLALSRFPHNILRRGEIREIAAWDKYWSFDRFPIAPSAGRIRQRLLSGFDANQLGRFSDSNSPAVIMERKLKPSFYGTSQAEIKSYGAERRSIPNLDELVSAIQLSSKIDGADSTPSEIIESVSRAKTLIGQYGAGLCHMIWLPAGATVVEISSRQSLGSYPRDCYLALASALNLNFVRLEIQESWHSKVDVDVVISALKEAAEGTGRLEKRFNFRAARFYKARAAIDRIFFRSSLQNPDGPR